MWKGKENGSRKGMNRNVVCIDILSLHQSSSCMYAAACLSLGCDMLFTETAIGFHGEPGAGKIPVARTIAMAMSRHWIKKAHEENELSPSFRQASAFDFFRGQSGSIFRPDIFDDGTFCEQQFQKIKAFTDVGNNESTSKERWELPSGSRVSSGSIASMTLMQPKNQKMICPCCRSSLVNMTMSPTRTGLHEDARHRMVRKAGQPKQHHGRAEAHSSVHQYKKLSPCETPGPVMRIPLDDKTDFLHLESRTVYDFYRKGGTDLAP